MNEQAPKVSDNIPRSYYMVLSGFTRHAIIPVSKQAVYIRYVHPRKGVNVMSSSLKFYYLK